MSKKPPVHFLFTENYPIYDQLCLEEAFMRTSKDFLIWINLGSPESIVLGISSKIEELVDLEKAQESKVPLIRRYSGGGTVVVDHNTLFVTMIFETDLFGIDPFPSKIMEWSSRYYEPILNHQGFKLRENDYVLGDKKFGGNAQYLSKKRFVHHSTLLWDLNPLLMETLKNPSKAPQYRAHRNHLDFLTTLKQHFPSKQIFVENLVQALKTDLNLFPTTPELIKNSICAPYRQSTHKVEIANFSHSDLQIQTDQKMLV